MTRKTANRRNAAVSADPRAFVLAGLGAVSLGRKQALKSYNDALASACALRKQAEGRAKALRTQVEAVVTPVALKAQSLASLAQAQLQPVLGKLGIAAAPKPARKAARKPVARKANTQRRRKAA